MQAKKMSHDLINDPITSIMGITSNVIIADAILNPELIEWKRIVHLSQGFYGEGVLKLTVFKP